MRTLTSLGFIFIILSHLSAPLAVFGQDLPTNALDTSNTGILPTNSFYFLKEFSRGIQKLFKTNPLSKAELESRILNEKASEVKKLYELNPHNLTGISKAILSYTSTAQSLKARLETLRGFNQLPSFDRLLNELLNRVITHQQFFDDLRGRAEFNSDFKAELDAAQTVLTDILATMAEKLDGLDKFSGRFLSLVAKHTGELKELRAVEVLDRLEDHLVSDELGAITGLKEELLIKFSGRLDSEALSPTLNSLLPQLEVMPGDQLRRVKVLDEIREIIASSDLKSQINIIRQRILEKAQEAGVINSEKAEEAIAAAKKSVADFETTVSGKILSAPVRQLLERAKFNFKQAQDLFSAGNYGGAYGQATASAAAIKNAINQMTSATDYEVDLSAVKKNYDSLLNTAKGLSLDAKNQPKLFALFAETEKKIAEVSKAIKIGSRPERIVQQLRMIKQLLGTIDGLLETAG